MKRPLVFLRAKKKGYGVGENGSKRVDFRHFPIDKVLYTTNSQEKMITGYQTNFDKIYIFRKLDKWSPIIALPFSVTLRNKGAISKRLQSLRVISTGFPCCSVCIMLCESCASRMIAGFRYVAICVYLFFVVLVLLWITVMLIVLL